MKKLICAILIISIFLITKISAAENKEQTPAEKWKINFNGQTTKIHPTIIEGKILLPLLSTAEALGLEIIVDKINKTLIILGEVNCSKNHPGLVEGAVHINLPKGNPMKFEGKKVVLTAVSNKPTTLKELKYHFYKDNYFSHHFPQAKATIDANGKFYILDVPPGEYDLLIFNKAEDTLGYHRVCWKLFVKVSPGQMTKVLLDRYNVTLYDYVLFQK